MPHQVSDTVRILRDRTTLGVRKLPMKRFSNNRITRNTKTGLHHSFLPFSEDDRAPPNQLGYSTLCEQQNFRPRGLFPLEVKLAEVGSHREELLESEISRGSAAAHSSSTLSPKTDGLDDAANHTSPLLLGRMFSLCS
ncbi:hypothetical protein F2Q70_00017717 [Brassica cretica]|uniref:Uncharacterized protein n=1 Tax=Brassica cretica TaxID=69181 RepID=A0A8S9I530_BRACR|nr:hypothetical protein F2Q70_00017717 [Brassica cretica]